MSLLTKKIGLYFKIAFMAQNNYFVNKSEFLSSLVFPEIIFSLIFFVYLSNFFTILNLFVFEFHNTI